MCEGQRGPDGDMDDIWSADPLAYADPHATSIGSVRKLLTTSYIATAKISIRLALLFPTTHEGFSAGIAVFWACHAPCSPTSRTYTV
jgi:hypothetical protein